MSMKKKKVYKASIAEVGEIEISKDRYEQIKRLQKMIKENNEKKVKTKQSN